MPDRLAGPRHFPRHFPRALPGSQRWRPTRRQQPRPDPQVRAARVSRRKAPHRAAPIDERPPALPPPAAVGSMSSAELARLSWPCSAPGSAVVTNGLRTRTRSRSSDAAAKARKASTMMRTTTVRWKVPFLHGNERLWAVTRRKPAPAQEIHRLCQKIATGAMLGSAWEKYALN